MNGSNGSNGPQSGVPTINQLITLSADLRRLAEHRAQPGARPGLLEVVEDAKGWAIILENIAKAFGKENEAWHRFPVDKSIPAMYDGVTKACETAARAMAGIPSTTERIERERLNELRNPRQNAQMLDHTANGYRGGQG